MARSSAAARFSGQGINLVQPVNLRKSGNTHTRVARRICVYTYVRAQTHVRVPAMHPPPPSPPRVARPLPPARVARPLPPA
eukprot:179858-Chlamydomonas_euryale.AAC.1